MRSPVPARADDLADPSKWRRPPAPFVIDVGSNVGWFTLNAAAAGGTVAAFEGGRGCSRLSGRRARDQEARVGHLKLCVVQLPSANKS